MRYDINRLPYNKSYIDLVKSGVTERKQNVAKVFARVSRYEAD